MDETDLLPASIRSGANFNVYPQYSCIEDRVALLHSVYKEIIDTMLITHANLHAKITIM